MSPTNPTGSTALQRDSRIPPSPSISIPSNSSTYSKQPNPRHSTISNLSSNTIHRSGGPPPTAPSGPPPAPPSASASTPRQHRRNPYAPEIRNSSTFFHPTPQTNRASNSSRLGGYHGGYHRAPAGPPPIPIIPGANTNTTTTNLPNNLPPGVNPIIVTAHPPPAFWGSSRGGGGGGVATSDDDTHTHSEHTRTRTPSPSIPTKKRDKRGKRQGLTLDPATAPLPARVKAGLWLLGTTPKLVAKAARQQKAWRAREREGRWLEREGRRGMLLEEEGGEGGSGDEVEGEEGLQEGGDGGGDGGEGRRQGGKGGKGGKRGSPPEGDGEREEWERKFERLGVRDE